MEKFKYVSKEKISLIPRTAGVYAFKNDGEILYIGKSGNLRERVKNHFFQPGYRDNLFVDQVKKIGFIETDSEIEALILEANLIKKYQPKYNVIWRDDKNYFYVEITKEECPRILISHQLKNNSFFIGPFVEGTALKRTLSLLRKIFPYYTQKKHPKTPCLWCHFKLCPGPNPDKNDYRRDIKSLILVLEGKKDSVLKILKKEMEKFSKTDEFEKAAKIRDQINALEKTLAHAKVLKIIEVQDVWKDTEKKLGAALNMENTITRIEACDISNIQGQKATGSIVSFLEGKPDKNAYRKFKIKITGKPNDTAMIKEVLSRRFGHREWALPELILIDGGKGQLNAALEIKNRLTETRSIKIISLAKRENELFIENRKEPLLLRNLPREISDLVLQLRDEAHRFARRYHLKLREIDLLPKL